MLERYNPFLRILCIALAGLVAWQVSRLTLRRDAFARSREILSWFSLKVMPVTFTWAVLAR